MQTNISEQVVVGAPLYELETEASGAATIVKAPVQTATAASPTPSAPAHTETANHGRIPSIKFIGKRSLAKHAPTPPAPVAVAVVAPAPVVQKFIPQAPARVIKDGGGVDFRTLKRGAKFVRPALYQKEMDSIESGGATY